MNWFHNSVTSLLKHYFLRCTGSCFAQTRDEMCQKICRFRFMLTERVASWVEIGSETCETYRISCFSQFFKPPIKENSQNTIFNEESNVYREHERHELWTTGRGEHRIAFHRSWMPRHQNICRPRTFARWRRERWSHDCRSYKTISRVKLFQIGWRNLGTTFSPSPPYMDNWTWYVVE